MTAYIVTLVLGLVGFITASAIRHKKRIGQELYCPLKSDCNSVVHSSYSKFFGIDVATLGVVYYGVISALYAFFILLPNIIPDYLYVIGFLLTVLAVIFSVYLLILQALVIHEWCFWCVTSAGISVALLVSSAVGLGANLHVFLLEYKTVIVVVHALSAALGMGTVLVTDIFFMKFLRDYRITEGEADILNTLSQIVWFALGLLILSGAALFIPASFVLLAKTKFIAKVIIVGVVAVNGVLLNLLVAPKLIKISFGDDSVDHPGELHHLRRLAFAFGAVSITSWLCTFILGSIRSINLSTGAILGIYAVIVVIAVLGSQIYDFKIRQQSMK